MIEINLLPDELKKRQIGLKKFDLANLNLKSFPVAKIVIMAAGILIVLHAGLFAAATYSNRTLKELSKKYNEILPNIREADVLKSRSVMMVKKVNAINELMVKRFSWAKKLNALSDSMTAGIWLTDISYDEKLGERTVTRPAAPQIPVMAQMGRERRIPAEPATTTVTEKAVMRYLYVSGCASSPGEDGAAVVGKFIKSLKDNPSFYSDMADIELGSIKSDRIEDQEVMRFKITCTFKEWLS
jgi:hypothetical protein